MRMDNLALDELDAFGWNAPLRVVENAFQFSPDPCDGAVRYRAELAPGIPIDALVANKGSEVLIVGLHGAVNRTTTELPRFERLRSILDLDVSSMYFSDPSLWKSDALQLSWYTGWDELDGHQLIAYWAVAAAQAVGAKRIIFTGSSGGGFAALQIASLVPNSLAVAFNAQTDIAQYRVNGESYGVQRLYVETVWPQIAATFQTAKDIEDSSWAEGVGERLSAVKRYSRPTSNYVFFIQNTDEFHAEDHFRPFLEAAAHGGNLDRIKTSVYEGGPIHNPPTQRIFDENIRKAVAWSETLPESVPRLSKCDAGS